MKEHREEAMRSTLVGRRIERVLFDADEHGHTGLVLSDGTVLIVDICEHEPICDECDGVGWMPGDPCDAERWYPCQECNSPKYAKPRPR